MIELRPYQREAIAASHAALEQGVGRQAVGLPTGTGKTVVFSQLVAERGHPALILAHRDELILQAVDKYGMVDPSTPVGIVKAGLHQADLPVVVASVQTLARASRRAQMPTDFKTLIVDEAHHAAADSYLEVLAHFRDVELVSGFSATLERADKKALGSAFDQIVYHRSIIDMIEAGYLVDIRSLAVEVRGLRMRDVKVSRGDYQDGALAQALHDTHADLVAVRAFREYAPDRRAIVFTPTIASAVEFARAFQADGIPATYVSGDLPIEERRQRLADFATGKYQVVANAQVLTEGYDEPSVDCVIVARPTKSRPLYVQMIGRGTRLYPGKDDLLVLDLIGVDSAGVDAFSVPRLFGLDPKKVKGRGVAEATRAARAEEAQLQERERQAFELRVREQAVFERKDVAWRKLGDGSWALSMGQAGSLLLARAGDGWAAYETPGARERPRLIRDGLDLGMAMGVAEERIRSNPKALALIDRNAPWRQGKPSDGQRNALAKWGVSRATIAELKTRGDASDLLTSLIAAKDLKLARAGHV